MMQSLFSKDMMKKVFCQGYLWLLLLLLYSPIFIIIIASFTTIVDLVMKAYTPALSRAMGAAISGGGKSARAASAGEAARAGSRRRQSAPA